MTARISLKGFIGVALVMFIGALVIAYLVSGSSSAEESDTANIGVNALQVDVTSTQQPATVVSTVSLTPSSVPTATLTPLPTRTPIPEGVEPHPLSIDMLRTRTYEGSVFTRVQTLRPGINYDQYVVSYLSDGLTIYALQTIPQGDPPPTGWPVVIFNHGYIPPAQYRTTQRYEAYVDAFALAGYIVIKSDYRGHGSSEGPASSAYGSQNYVIDVLNATASAKIMPGADPNRIGMWGHSMGGWITTRAMVVDPDIKAGVIWGGVVGSYDDLFEVWWGNRNPSGWRARLIREYGSAAENPFFWDSLSATSYLHELSGPIQLHHARGDDVVPYELSVLMDEYLQDANQHTELLLYPGDDHNISRNRDLAFTLSVVFFDRFVKDIY